MTEDTKPDAELLGTCEWNGRTDPSYNTSFHQGPHPGRTTCIKWQAVADAGPRQPGTIKDACDDCGKPFGSIILRRGERRLHPVCAGYEMDVQEIKTREYQAILKHSLDATAPDGAMRVAEQIRQMSARLPIAWDSEAVEKIAALIRQAWSERERRLTSRLLGGESNAL